MVSLIIGKRGSGKTTLCNKLLKDYKRVIIIDRLGEYDGTIVNNELDVINVIMKNPRNYKISVRLQEDRENLFKVLYAIKNYCLVVEELSMFCSSYYIDRYLHNILAYGRHRNISFIGVSQRPAQIHPMVRSQADNIYSFKMLDHNDIKYLSFFGFNDLDKLNRYEYKKISY